MKKSATKIACTSIFCKIFLLTVAIMLTCNVAGVDLTFMSIKPAYKIYFGQKRGLSEKLYFLPCADTVLVISVGKTAVFGQGPAAIKSMQQKARIKAQNQLETFVSAQMSAKEKVISKDSKTVFLASFSKTISREISVWEIIGTGFSSDRKSFCCIIGKVFPKKSIPPSLFN